MKLTKKECEDIKSKFDNFTNDSKRWNFIKHNQHIGIIIYLDNDDTFGVLTDNEKGEHILQFDNYLGTGDWLAVKNLLNTFGIKAEEV